MQHKMWIAIAAAAMLAWMPLAAAQANDNGNKPPELESRFEATAPYGSAKLRWMGLKVYTSSLWLDAEEWSYDSPFALTIVYDMNFSRKQLVEKSVEEVERIHGLDKDALDTLDTELKRLFPNVRKGDRITALYEPEKAVAFFHNGEKTGDLTDVRLLVPFMDIWLSEQTERPEVRRQMLGL